MAVETLELRVVVSGGSQANSELQAISRSVSGMNDALRFMRSALVLLSFARVFSGIFEVVNAFQTMQNKLRLVTSSTQEAQAAQITLAKAAIATRASYEDTVNVFAGLARSTKSLNLDYGQLLTLTKEWNESIVVSGVDQQQARNALKDFIEELNLGVIQGRQLRALLMQNPEFLRLMAEGMAKVGKASDPWFAAVRKATEGGKTLTGAALFELNKEHPGSITSTQAVMAAMMGADEEAKKFNQTQTTIGQAFTILQTKATVFIATLTQKTGALDWLKDAMSWIGDHLDSIAEAVAAFAGLLIINTITGAFATFGGTAGAVFGMLFRSITNIMTLLRNMLILMTTEEGALLAPLLVIGAAIYAVFHTQMAQAADSFGQQIQKMGGYGEFFVRFLATLGAEFQTVFGNIGLTLRAVFITITNFVISAYEMAINKWIQGINWLSGKLDTILPKALQIGSISDVHFTHVENDAASQFQQKLAQNAANNYRSLQGVSNFFKSFDLNNMKGELNLAGKPPGAGQEAGIDATKDQSAKIRAALESIEGILSKFGGPLAKFRKDWEDTSLAIAKATAVIGGGKIAALFSAAGFDDFNTKTGQSVELMKAMERESLGLKDANKELANTEAMIKKALDDKAISLEESIRLETQARIAALGENQGSVNAGVQVAALKYNQALMDQNKIAEDVVSSALKEQESLAELKIQYQALTAAVDAGVLSSEAMASKLRDLQLEYLKTQTDMESGFVRGMLDVQKSMDDTATTAASALENSFKSLEDTLVTFFDTGKLNVRKFADEVLAQFTRVAVQGAIMQPLANLMGFGAGQTTGSSPTTSFLSTIFGGGSGSLPGLGGQLGGDPTNPMWVQMVGIGTTIGSLPGALGGGSSGGLSLSNPGSMFSQGGIFGGGGFLSNLFSGTGGGAGSASSGILGALGDVGSFLGFASGADFMVGGQPGTDANLVAFRASSDERVVVQTPAQQRAAAAGGPGAMLGSPTYNLHLHGVSDADSFRRSTPQTMAGMSRMADHHAKRNGGKR